MNEIITTTKTNATNALTLPVPNAPIKVRIGTAEDLPFMDELQKQYGKQLGFFTFAQMKVYVDGGWVLIAEDAVTGERVGFVCSRDRYLKRDELGAIFQLCVSPGGQRRLIGATLLKAVFERAAYGTKLFCCWCAQDIAANFFWEAMGFVPLAVRAGSDKKARTHVFWQKRIRSGDTTTPWWFPSATDGGAMREGRVVLPIPPGVHWSAARAVPRGYEPGSGADGADTGVGATGGTPPVLVEGATMPEHGRRTARGTRAKKVAVVEQPVSTKRQPVVLSGALQFAAPVPVVVEEVKQEKPKRPKREKAKIDPAVAAASRELRDRWTEQLNAAGGVLPVAAKYDVSRAIEAGTVVAMLPAA